MHVLMITNYFAPEGGAAAVRLTRLAKKLHGRGHRVTVLTSMPHYPRGRVYEGYRRRFSVVRDLDGIRVVQTWLFATSSPRISRKLVSQLTFMLSAMLRGLLLPRADVVLIEGQPVFTAIAGVILATVKRQPYVLNVSDLWPDHLLSVGALSVNHPVYRLARRTVDTIYRRATRIVAMSPRWAEIIESYVDRPGHIETILNGVDLDVFKPELDSSAFRRRYNLGDKKIVSFIGSFSTPYDFETMLSVAARISQHDQAQVVFIGRGSQEHVLRRHLNDIPNLKWILWVDYEDIPQAWSASWVTYFALRNHALYHGTIPAKLYEAMASGVPVVAALEGLGAEFIERSGAGVAVACGDEHGLARALEEVLDRDSQRAQYSAAARRYAEAHFDADQVALAYERTLLAAAANAEAKHSGSQVQDGAANSGHKHFNR